MDEYPHFYFEDDIRTKVVTACLANRGFGPPDISVEYSFEIHLGRKVFSIVSKEPRAKRGNIEPTIIAFLSKRAALLEWQKDSHSA